jgi:hypothetical protein
LEDYFVATGKKPIATINTAVPLPEGEENR